MDAFLTRHEASEFLEQHGLTVSPNTLQKFATTGGGPRYAIFGNRAVYTKSDLERWVSDKLSSPREKSTQVDEVS
jgi:hypothetical protein